jgi:hypothetical protein
MENPAENSPLGKYTKIEMRRGSRGYLRWIILISVLTILGIFILKFLADLYLDNWYK